MASVSLGISGTVQQSGVQPGEQLRETTSTSGKQRAERSDQQQRSKEEDEERQQQRQRLKEQEELLQQWQRDDEERSRQPVQPVGRAGPYARPNPTEMLQALEVVTIQDYQKPQPTADYLPGHWHSDALLDSLDWEHLSSVLSLGRPMDFLPTNLVIKVRRVFNYCFQILFADPGSETNWKRLLLLPTILFIETGNRRRADLSTKCDLILANQWPFTVGDYSGRMSKPKDNG